MRLLQSIIILVFLTSCSSWLDVGSKSEVDEDEMFRSAEGYYSSMTGLYLNLGTKALYGGNLPLLALEPLTQQYTISADEPDRVQWMQFNYETDGGQTLVNEIWLTMYNTIVNANMLLQQMDHGETVLDRRVCDILRGEALGLRALMYFDLVRMFNEAPAVDAESSNVPLKTDFGFELGEQVTTGQLLDFLVSDIIQARSLLQYDPLVSPITDAVLSSNAYLAYDRRQRMNYDACTALLARMELYRGHYADADAFARELLDCGRYRYISADEIVMTDAYGAELSADRIFMSEQIFALYTDQILTTSRTYYEGLMHDFVKTADLLSDGDVRRHWLFANPSALGKINLIRYQQPTRQQDQQRYGVPVVPMLKLSEMQLIAAECALHEGRLDEARQQLNTLRQARGEAPLPATAEVVALNDALTHEYQCDFRGEGQLFYYYKRRGLTTIDDGNGKGNTLQVPAAAYTLPLPPYEKQFGYGKKQ